MSSPVIVVPRRVRFGVTLPAGGDGMVTGPPWENARYAGSTMVASCRRQRRVCRPWPALDGNGRGIAGVAPEARLVVAKALNAKGSGSTDDINAGIAWVVSKGARVVNLSLGPEFTVLNPVIGSGIEPGIEFAFQHGAIPVLA